MKKVIATAALVVAICSMSACGAVQPDKNAQCTVTGKDRTSKSDGTSEMRVYTKQCGTFVVADSLTRGQFRSSDLYGKLQKGHTYEFTYHGWRSGIFSMFPNITEATEVK